MDEDLTMLLDLQSIDDRMDQLRRDKGDYPKRIETLEGELREAEESLQAQKDRTEELEKMRRHYERELERTNEELKKHQARLYEVKTNKEYDALQQEIEVWRNSVDQNETSLVETMDELEELTAKIEAGTELSEEEKQTRQAEIEELSSKLSVIEDQIEREQMERRKVTGRMEKRLLTDYERIRKAKGEMAVARISRQACGGCFTRLPPQLVAELRKGDRIIHCERCGRIMVWDERST